MGLFIKLKRKLTEHSFRRKNLAIIQDIPRAVFTDIFDTHISNGWEVAPEHEGFNPMKACSACKIRKGQSVLIFDWGKYTYGSIVGPQRILVGVVATEASLILRKVPKWT